jgi:lipopolysaccharide export LptBFGC system permease protein LptF
MHALQALPLLALALTLASRRFARLRDEQTRVRIITTAGIAYAGLVVLVTWQALRGQSIVSPDALTLAGLGLVAMVVLAGAAWSLRRKDTVA